MTGVTSLSVELGPKLLELLHDSASKATIMALLVNPTNPNLKTQSRDLQAAVLKLGLQPHVVNASTELDFDAVFAKLHELRDALMISQDPFFNSQKRTAWRTVGPPRDTCDLRGPRVRRGRRPDELWG